jgi:alanyl-tRNA synthetase
VNWNEFEMQLRNLQTKSIKCIQKVSNNYSMQNIPKTDDSYKYKITRHSNQTYVSPVVTAKLLAIIDMNGNIVTEPDITKHGVIVSLVLDKTCFYSKAGGQQHDIGTVKTNNGKIFNVNDVEKIQENGIVLHFINSIDWPILLKY